MIAVTLSLGIVFSIISFIAAFFLLPRKERVATAIIIGMAFMLGAIFVQSILQSVPVLYLIFIKGLGAGAGSAAYVALEKSYPLLIAAFLGLMAGFWQELAKFFAVKYNSERLAPWVGYGFAAIDVMFFLVALAPGLNISASQEAAIGLASIIPVILQAPFSMAFHTGTAAFLKKGIEQDKTKAVRNLAIAILAHAYIDGSLDYATILIALLGLQHLLGDLIIWIPSVMIALVFLAYLSRYIKHTARS